MNHNSEGMTNHDIYTVAPILIVLFVGSLALMIWGGELPYLRDLHGVALPVILAPVAVVSVFGAVYLAAMGRRVATRRGAAALAWLPLVVILLTLATTLLMNFS